MLSTFPQSLHRRCWSSFPPFLYSPTVTTQSPLFRPSRSFSSSPDSHFPRVRVSPIPSSSSSPSTFTPSPFPETNNVPSDPYSLLEQLSISQYWDTRAPTRPDLQFASRFFRQKKPSFLFSVPRFRDLPPDSPVSEVAFLGRSNVGKSSLVNELMGVGERSHVPYHRGGAAAVAAATGGSSTKPSSSSSSAGLARVSNKPGKTQMLNIYGVGVVGGTKNKKVQIKGGKGKQMAVHERWIGTSGREAGLVLVDTPGYGFLSRDEWGEETIKYLTRRKQLRRAFVLINAEHGILESDQAILQILRLNGVPHQVILTKADMVLKPKAVSLPSPELPGTSGSSSSSSSSLPSLSSRGIAAPSKTYELESLQRGIARLQARCSDMRSDLQPPDAIGGTALGEILVCSTKMFHDMSGTRPLGIDGIRWAIMQAAGISPS